MHRVGLALMLGMALLLVAYGQFKALPGQVDDSPSLAAVIQEALVACTSSDAGELCPLSRDYMSKVSAIPDATTLFLLVAARFAILLAFA
jgi:hypothetical protein